MNEFKVTIIVVNWKQPQLTIACAESVIKSTYKNFRLFIVNNNSFDDSAIILKNRFKNNSKNRIIQTGRNLGYGGGNNYGVKKALEEFQSEYICFLNNDTIVDRDFLHHLLSAGSSLGRQNIYFPILLDWGSRIIQSAGLNDYIPRTFQFRYSGKKYNNNLPTRELPYLGGCCFLITTGLFSALSGFRNDFFMYCEDVDLGIRAKKLGTKFFLVPKSLVWHKESGSTRLFSPSTMYYSARNTMYLIHDYAKSKKYEYSRACLWFLALILVNLLRLELGSAMAIIRGLLAFIHGKKGQTGYSF